FQAEDGIRDFHVTGVQTCALPISAKNTSPVACPHRSEQTQTARARRSPRAQPPRSARPALRSPPQGSDTPSTSETFLPEADTPRSEERRVGKESRSRGARASLREG